MNATVNRAARRRAAKALSIPLAPLVGAFALAPSADAQLCEIVRTQSTSTHKLTIERAFPDCTAPDTVTAGGIPACGEFLPEPSDWTAADVKPLKTKIQLKIKSTKDGDVTVQLKAKGIGGIPEEEFAEGTGTLRFTTRLILEDPSGPMRTAPFELTMPVTVTKGKANAASTVNTMMQEAGLGQLPPCFRGDFDEIVLEDPSGDPFGSVTQPAFSRRSSTTFGTRG